MPSRRSLLAALALAATCGCSRGEKPASGTPGAPAGPARVKLALNWVPEPEFGGFYAARETGAYREAGLDVQIEGGGAGAPVVQRVAAGQAEFGIAGADDVVVARARGVDVVGVFATFQSSPQAIMVHAARGMKSLADVFRAGGTLAIEPGHPYAAWLKKKYGFEGVKIAPYDGGVARFVADPQLSQQCFVTSEPIAAKQQGSDPQVFLVAESGYDPYTAVVIVRGALMRENPGLVRSFVRASADGWRTYLADPRPANQVMAKLNPSMDAATFEAAALAQRALLESDDTRRAGLGAMRRERWATLATQLAELGVVPQAPPAEQLFADLSGSVAASAPR